MRMISDIHTHTHTQFPPLLVLALQKPAIKKLSHIHTHRESLLDSGERVTRHVYLVCVQLVYSYLGLDDPLFQSIQSHAVSGHRAPSFSS